MAGSKRIGIAPQRSPLCGALVGIAEGGTGFILTGLAAGHFQVATSGGYDVTDLAFLPDGDCPRSWSGASPSRRLRLPPAPGRGCTFRPGARLDGEIIYESEPSHQVDNMEGLASTGKALKPSSR